MNVPFTWRGASRVPQVILIGIMMEVPLRICALPGVMNSPITNLVALASTVFVPTSVLIECRKLLAPDSEEILSDDERTIAASRVVDELMGLKGYLRFGVYTETVVEKETPDQSEQFLIREFSLSDEDLS